MNKIMEHVTKIPRVKGMTDQETKEFKESVQAYIERYIINWKKFKLRKWDKQ